MLVCVWLFRNNGRFPVELWCAYGRSCGTVMSEVVKALGPI